MRSSATSASRVNWPGSATLVTLINLSFAPPRMAYSFVFSSGALN
jgi:hypothetical protein